MTPAENGADISITAHREGQAVRIEVADNGNGEGAEIAASPSTGVGLANIGTGCRRPMAPDIVSIPKRTTAGGLALLSKYPMKPETRPDDHPDHLVDDEPLATQGLQLRLQAFDDVEIVGTAANGREAIRQVKIHKPDLVFLDIQMPGFDGFSVIQGLMDVEPPLFVFVTAFGEHALRAFDAQAVDYLMKPVDADRLAATMDRVRQRLNEKRSAEESERLKEALAEHAPEAAEELADATPDAHAANRYERMINIKDQGQIFRVDVDTIERIDAAGDYMCIQTGDNTLILRETMKDLEKRLDPRRFQRVHRSTIVNLDLVRQVKPHTNGECSWCFDLGAQVKVSQATATSSPASCIKPRWEGPARPKDESGPLLNFKRRLLRGRCSVCVPPPADNCCCTDWMRVGLVVVAVQLPFPLATEAASTLSETPDAAATSTGTWAFTGILARSTCSATDRLLSTFCRLTLTRLGMLVPVAAPAVVPVPAVVVPPPLVPAAGAAASPAGGAFVPADDGACVLHAAIARTSALTATIFDMRSFIMTSL